MYVEQISIKKSITLLLIRYCVVSPTPKRSDTSRRKHLFAENLYIAHHFFTIQKHKIGIV